MGRSGCVQNTSIGCGNNLLILLINQTFDKNVNFDTVSVYHYCVFKPLFYSMSDTKCYRQNERTDHRIISWFSFKCDFDMVFTSQIRAFHAKPTFSISCIIDIFSVCNTYTISAIILFS